MFNWWFAIFVQLNKCHYASCIMWQFGYVFCFHTGPAAPSIHLADWTNAGAFPFDFHYCSSPPPVSLLGASQIVELSQDGVLGQYEPQRVNCSKTPSCEGSTLIK